MYIINQFSKYLIYFDVRKDHIYLILQEYEDLIKRGEVCVVKNSYLKIFSAFKLSHMTACAVG